MRLLSISHHARRNSPTNEYLKSYGGFTLPEMLIGITLITLLAGIGVVAGIDSYRRYLFRADTQKFISALQHTRMQAVNNMNGSSHGIYMGDPAAFVVFQGESYATRTMARDVQLEKNPDIMVAGALEIVFARLSGRSTDSSITLSDGTRSTTILVNSEGGITW